MVDRRDLIKLGAGAVLTAQIAPGAPRFFTSDEYAVVDDLCEMIIPADEKSPGAKAAKVVEYIDSTLAEAFEQIERDDFRGGLKIFVATPAPQRLALLTKASRHERSPKTAEEKFFRLLKGYTIEGYYSSKIGVHDDLDYKGNTYQRGEYAGEL